jgi:hypothetical protein
MYEDAPENDRIHRCRLLDSIDELLLLALSD